MKCSFCSKKSIYSRKNDGRDYCENHFRRDVEKKVRRTLSKYRLVVPDDRVAVALSGGKDSANILYFLKRIFGENPKIEVAAITLDQGIKGETRKNVKIAKDFCRKFGVAHHVFTFKEEFGMTVDQVKNRDKVGFCAACGALRRYLINKKARELGFTKVATGHNLDDECQSIIMNLLKGDLVKLSRVGPMPGLIRDGNFVPRIKPLIFVQERESRLFAELNGMDVNYCACKYSKFNAMRGETKIYLNRLEERAPGLKYSLIEASLKMNAMLKVGFEGKTIGKCKKCGEPTSQELCKICTILEGVKTS
ncbi:TIGR00269 family protein [Candidatus Micrarchaeota archaeon RBG_16_49_10]|nr:MAG: TIGR00269 family protein [Candidatus Micrarchaeota archaeon RBG_16_49_10]